MEDSDDRVEMKCPHCGKSYKEVKLVNQEFDEKEAWTHWMCDCGCEWYDVYTYSYKDIE